MEESIIFKNISPEKLKEIVSEATIEAVKKVLDSRKEVKYLSRQEARKILGISLPSLDKQITRGKIRAQRIGGRVLITESDLKNALTEIPARKK
jgi:excisionase family DNA binding protein